MSRFQVPPQTNQHDTNFSQGSTGCRSMNYGQQMQSPQNSYSTPRSSFTNSPNNNYSHPLTNKFPAKNFAVCIDNNNNQIDENNENKDGRKEWPKKNPWTPRHRHWKARDDQENDYLDHLFNQLPKKSKPVYDTFTEYLYGHKCDLSEVHMDQIDKDSDVSDFVADDGPYTEEKPLDAGWNYAIFMGHYPTENPDVNQIEVYTRNGIFSFHAVKQYVDGLGGCTYVRFKRDLNNNYQIYPSTHRHSIMGAVKVRPHKSLECRIVALVAFTSDEQAPVPVWSDAVGWRKIDWRRAGVFRKGLVDMGREELFRPLRLIEFTIKIKTDIPQTVADCTRDAVKITDVSPLTCFTQEKEDKNVPDCCYPKSTKRISDLSFKTFLPKSTGVRAIFTSESYPNIKFWATTDQCAFSENEQNAPLAGVFIPHKPKDFRALIVAPIQRLYRMTKGHSMDYKKLPPKTFNRPVTSDAIEQTKRIHNQLFNNIQHQNRSINWFT